MTILRFSKETFITLIIGMLAIILFWGDILFGFHFLYDLDIHTEFLPLQNFLKFSSVNGGHGWWNPFSGLGTPALAGGHGNNYYLPTMLYRLFNGGHQQLGVLFGLHLLYCFYFLRKLAEEIGIEYRYSFFPAIIFTFCGSLTAITGIFPYALGITHTPALFYFLTRLINQNRKEHALLLGILFSQFFMTGYFPFIFNTIVAMTVFFIFTIPWKNYFHWLPNLCLAALTAILFSLPQWLPTLQLVTSSVFNSGMKFEHMISNSLSPKLMLSYIFPSIWGFNDPLNFSYSDHFTDRTQGFFDFDELHNYLGLLPLFFAFLSLKTARSSRYTKALWALTITSFILALGGYAPLIYKPLSFIPGFNFFKNPIKWTVHFNFCLSLLAGFGLQLYFKDKRSIKKNIIHVLIISSPLLAGVVFFKDPLFTKHLIPSCQIDGSTTFWCHLTDEVLPISQTLLITLGSAILMFLPLSAIRKSIAIMLFVFLELLIVESPIILRTDKEFYAKPTVIQKLNELGFGTRTVDGVIPKEIDTLGLNHLSGDIGAYYQVPTLTTTSPLVTKAWAELEEWSASRGMIDLQRFSSIESQARLTPLLASLNVGQVLNPEHTLTPIPNALPRAYLSYSAVSVPESDQLKYFLSSCEAGHCLEAVVSTKAMNKPSQHAFSPAKMSFISTEKIRLEVNALAQGVLVYTDQYYPGWKVRINGKAGEIIKVNGLFKGVEIKGPGFYEVEFSFEPDLYIWTGRWFWFCWLILVPLAGWYIFRRRLPYGF